MNKPDAELDSSLCSSDNEVLKLSENPKRSKLRKKRDLTGEIEFDKESENKNRKISKASGDQNEIEIEGEEDNFIAQYTSKAPNKSLAHTIFSREKTQEEKKTKQKQVKKAAYELITAELEDEYLTSSDQGIVTTDIPERILLRYVNK